ncbi:MAG TPA: serine--tRNA ligase [Candidatus Dormibacteraeota bacterium]|nr:serine--tRNA ligase [Candidatus Dormibacteraeota bacterium]
MLDIVVIRRDPDRVRQSLRRRSLDPSVVDEILRLDAEYRSTLVGLESAQAARKALSAEIGMAADKAAATAERRPQLDALAGRIAQSEERVRELAPDAGGSPLRALLEQMPNLLDESVPDGNDESANVIVRAWGDLPHFDFAPKAHWELGEALGILDFERAARLSGSRFSLLKGNGARLSRALAQFFLDRAAQRGYEEIAPPYLVSRATMWSTGQLSTFADAMFHDADTDLYLIPTAEVPLTALHGGEILDARELPRKYAAFTPCFRKEAGAAGKDTRGLVRQHQFEKVELVWLAQPQHSSDALETLTDNAAALLRELELPHRVVALCSGETGFNAAKTYDVEVWLPNAGSFREISSCSNCTDFQARRAAIRFRSDAKSKPELVHTLNGSGLAIGRTLVAILENFQRADGTVAIPQALRPYAGFDALA